MAHTTLTSKVAVRGATNEHEDSSGVKNHRNPTTKSVVEAKTLEHLKNERPTNGIEGLANVNFQSKMTTLATITQDIKTFEGTSNAVSYLTTSNKPELVWRDDARANGGKSISKNFHDNFEAEFT